MSILRKAHVALSNLGVKGYYVAINVGLLLKDKDKWSIIVLVGSGNYTIVT